MGVCGGVCGSLVLADKFMALESTVLGESGPGRAQGNFGEWLNCVCVYKGGRLCLMGYPVCVCWA